MKEIRYFIKSGSDGTHRFYIEEAEVKILSHRQATRKDIKTALADIRAKRVSYDAALMEYIK